MFKKWRAKRKAAADTRAYNNGYNWAAGCLLRGEYTPYAIEALTYKRLGGLFDKGASDAMERLVRMFVVADDRTWSKLGSAPPKPHPSQVPPHTP